MFAALLGYAIANWMAPEAASSWGWRIPFFIGCAIVPFLYMIRRRLEETPEFAARKVHPTTREIFATLADNWLIVLGGVAMVMMTTVSFYLITVYTPTFGRSVLKLTESDALLVTIAVAASNFLWLPLSGALSDRIGRKPILVTFAVLALLTAYPALAWLVRGPTFDRMLTVELWLSFIYACYNGAMVVALTEIIPASVRTSGFSLAYSLATTLGGSSLLISTWLIAHTGDKAAPGYWMSFAAVCGLIATLSLYRRPPDGAPYLAPAAPPAADPDRSATPERPLALATQNSAFAILAGNAAGRDSSCEADETRSFQCKRPGRLMKSTGNSRRRATCPTPSSPFPSNAKSR